MEERANVIVGAVLGVVLVIALVVVVAVHLASAGNTGELRALVHDGDGKTYELSLSMDSTTTVTTSLGTNVVVVKDGSVYVSEADCKNHDCMRQGSLDAPGKQIICLPHKLWIEVVSDPGQASAMNTAIVAGDPQDIDAVTR